MKFPDMKLSDKLNLISSVAAYLESQSDYLRSESVDYEKRAKESETGHDEYYESESRNYRIRADIFDFLLSKLSDL